MSEGHGPLLQQFFSQNGSSVLLCAFQNERLYMSTQTDKMPSGTEMLVYIIRLVEKGKNLGNFDQDLAFGTFGSDHVSSLVLLLQNVFNATVES